MKNHVINSRLFLGSLIVAASLRVPAAPSEAVEVPPRQGVDTSQPKTAATADDRLGELITIPAGSFLMGNNGNDGFGGPEEFPQHSVHLPTYQIGKHEVTRGQYRPFIEAGGYQNPAY